MHQRDKLFINGRWVAPAGHGSIVVIEASTEQVMGSVPEGDADDADDAVAAAREPVVAEEIEVEFPHRGEVMIKLAACGICHSDLSATTGTIPFPPPLVLGHEGAGD